MSRYYCTTYVFQVEYIDLSPLSVSEGDSIDIGSGLVLSDVDSNNSMVYIDRILIEVVDGSPVERLYFADASSGNGEDSDWLEPTMSSSSVSCINSWPINSLKNYPN